MAASKIENLASQTMVPANLRRLPEDTITTLEKYITETGIPRSKLVRNALIHYAEYLRTTERV